MRRMTLEADERYMGLALEQARLAAQMGEVPIGAVVVRDVASGGDDAPAGKGGGAFTAATDAANAVPTGKGTAAAGEKGDAPIAATGAAGAVDASVGDVPTSGGRDELVAAACNHRETDADPAAHAEFLAIEAAARALGRWRLSDCTIYVTLEPCLMCAGLMYQARIRRCVFAAADPKAGALGTLYSVHADERLNHRFEACGGVRADESAALLKTFFTRLREAR